MKGKYTVLTLLSLLSIITFLDRNAIGIAGIRITKDLALTDAQFGWVLTAFTVAYAIFEIPMGIWGDRFGEKGVIFRIVISWSVFTALTGVVTGFTMLLVTRFLFGAGEAGAYPNSAIAIKKWFAEQERGRAQAVIWMFSRIGAGVTPFIVIPLQINFGWRASFLALGVIGIIWSIVWLKLYRSPVSDVQLNHEAPTASVKLSTILKQRSFIFLLLMYYCYASGVFFFISWLPKYLHNGRGIPEEDLAVYAAAPFFVAAVGCWLGGSLSDWMVRRLGVTWGRRVVPMAGLGLSGVMILLTTQTESNYIAIVLLALGLATMDVTAPVSWAVATDVGIQNVGTVTGTMNMVGLIAGSVTSLGVGYLVTMTGNYDLPVVILGSLLLLGAGCWWWIDAR